MSYNRNTLNKKIFTQQNLQYTIQPRFFYKIKFVITNFYDLPSGEIDVKLTQMVSNIIIVDGKIYEDTYSIDLEGGYRYKLELIDMSGQFSPLTTYIPTNEEEILLEDMVHLEYTLVEEEEEEEEEEE